MKIYHSTRSKARNAKGSTGKVVDCKSKPSANGYRWAVEYSKK